MKRASAVLADNQRIRNNRLEFGELRKNIISFLKAWTLPVSMVTGFIGYVTYSHLHFFDFTHSTVKTLIEFIQPILIFLMLFVTFCKVNPRQLHIDKWHIWLMLVQVVSFASLSSILYLFPASSWRVIIESAMICMITPTATAAAVITDKLGGKPASIISYTMFANLVTAVAAPIAFPAVHPIAGASFASSFSLILSKVFPLLICPFFAAVFVQKFMPRLLNKILKTKDLAFYMWALALALAIGVTTHTIFNSRTSFGLMSGIAAVSLFCCLIQFYLGRLLSKPYGDTITGGQALGQKSTVLAIWMGYTFLSPITALAGGFYSVWHNVVNSWQLYNKRVSK